LEVLTNEPFENNLGKKFLLLLLKKQKQTKTNMNKKNKRKGNF